MEASLVQGSLHNNELQKLQAIILAPRESNYYSNQHIRMAFWLLLRHKQLARKGTSETCCVKCSRLAVFFEELYETCVTGS